MAKLPRLHIGVSLPALAALLLVLTVACGAAATATPPQPTATTAPAAAAPTPGPTTEPGTVSDGTPTPLPYAFAARAFIQELDERFPFPPPEPPWPPRRGGVLQLSHGVVPDVDPVKGWEQKQLLVYDRLLEWEASWHYPEVQTTPTIRGNLAESWTMVDASTWDFKLKEGVLWQDIAPVSGRELTAEDIKYSYDTLKDKPGWSTGAGPVQEVEVLDRYTVRFHLKLPLADFPLLHTDGFAPLIIPREAVEAAGGLAENPVGSGPFMMKEFVSGEGFLTVRNPDYHMTDRDGQQLPYLDGVRVIFARDDATRAALFRTKQIDFMTMPTLDMLNDMLRTVPDAHLYRIPSFGWTNYALMVNFEKPPFDDPRVRQALSLSINREILIDVIGQGDASLYGPFPWALAGYYDREEYSYENLGANYQYNPQRARELLDEAGYPNGFQMEIEWAEFRGYVFGDFVVMLARFFEEIGVRVNLRQLEFATWNTKRFGAEPFNDSLAAFGGSGSGPTAWDWVYQFYHSSSPPTVNLPHIQDPQVDAMLDEWRVSDSDQQAEILQELWTHLGDQMYRINTVVPSHKRLTQSYVMNPAANPYCWFQGFCNYEVKNVWLTDEAPARRSDRFGQ